MGVNVRSLNPLQPQQIVTEQLKQIEVGSDHTILLTQSGEVYVAGIHNNQTFTKLQFPNPIKQTSTNHTTTFLLTTTQQLYTLESIYPIHTTHQVQFISTGYQFAVFISNHGQLYSFGSNNHGELGHGDLNPREQPTLIKTVSSHKVTQLSCGFKHTIIKTALNKVYTWGWGQFGQLANSSFSNALLPILIPINSTITHVAAAYRSTIIITENRNILWTGSNATIQFQTTFTQLKIQVKSNVLTQSYYSPIRILTTYSRTLSIIYLTYANHNHMWTNQPTALKATLQTLSTKWIETSPLSIDPPIIESLQHYIQEKHVKLRPSSPQPHMHAITTHQNRLRSPKNSKTLFSPPFSPRHQTLNSVDQSIPCYSPKSQNITRIDQQTYFTPILKNDDKIKIYDNEPISQPTKPKIKNQNYQSRLLNRMKNKKINTTSKKRIRTTADDDDDDLQLNSQPLNQSQKQYTTHRVVIQEENDDNETKYLIFININLSSIKKLRDIKLRLIRLKSTPEYQWSKADHEFLQSIYKSNLSSLLEQF